MTRYRIIDTRMTNSPHFKPFVIQDNSVDGKWLTIPGCHYETREEAEAALPGIKMLFIGSDKKSK